MPSAQHPTPPILSDGVVSLRGTVPDEARRKLALETAKKVDGVKELIDLIAVAK